MKSLKLNEQTSIPILGFGTWQLEGDVCQKAVEIALETGYRHIDTAKAYGNHKIIGQVLQKSAINRKNIFLTSKVWITDMKRPDLLDAFKTVLEDLQTDYLDLYLLHWPIRNVAFSESLGSLNELKQQGKIKAFGVSNFNVHHLQDALAIGMEITNNQVEFHPSLYQKDLKEFCDKNKILLTAYSPVGRGRDLKLPVIKKLSDKYKRTPSQIILSWIISKNIIAIPKATSPDHIKQNFEAIQLALAPEDLKLIDSLNTNNRLVNPSFSDFDY